LPHHRKFLHTSLCPIRWGDMDAQGHVNNTVYFRYMEQARIEWLERFGWPGSSSDPMVIVTVNAACTYLLPLTYPAAVETRVFASKPGRSSVETWYEMRVAGDDVLCAEGSAKLVWVDAASGKSRPLPDALRAALVD
jgi:acyl-CoA thioester hydrolase